MTGEERPRPIVALKKITYPNGEQLTRSLVRFDIESRSYNPDSDVINQLLPTIDHEYEMLVEKCREVNITDALDHFFEETSEIAVVGDGLRESLASDLAKDVKDIEKALMETKWFKSTLSYIKSEFRKVRKTDSIKYAESVRQLVDTFGSSYAIYLLNREGINISRSTIAGLCRVAGETPKVKKLVRYGKLKLTIAFELPNAQEKEREKLAEQIAGMSYDKQKRFLKKAKSKHAPD